jgi:autotransporter-associated beta strand protein
MQLESRLAPAIATWDGGGADNHWSTPANWVGDVAPAPGDDLVFPAGAAQLQNVNDTVGAFASLSTTGAGYNLSGNAVTVTGGINADTPMGGSSTIALSLGGIGGLTKNGAGTLVLSGANSYAGLTSINVGAIDARTGTALGAAGPGNETLITNHDGALLLNGTFSISEPITVTGNNTNTDIAAVHVTGGDVTYGGTLNVAQNTWVAPDAGTTLTITGTIQQMAGPGPRGLSLGSFGTLVMAPSSTVTHTAGISVLGLVLFNGVLNDPITFISPGFFPPPPVHIGIVSGTGTVGAIDTVTGIVDPGNVGVAGTLATGDLHLRFGSRTVPTYRVDVTPTGADRLAVHGTVTLGGQLNVNVQPGFTPAIGAHYKIIDNDGADPIVFAFNNFSEGSVVRSFGNTVLRITYVGGDGNDVELVTATAASVRRFAVGAGAGATPTVNVYDGTGALVRTFNAYDPAFRGGVRVASGDINHDGVPDVVTAPGPGGGPHIKVFDGVSGALLYQFFAYDAAFFGGVFVATADFQADGFADIITGAGRGGGPHVKVFRGLSVTENASFFAYDAAFTGGVTVAGVDAKIDASHNFIDGEVITGAGPGGGPHVKAFRMDTFTDVPDTGPFPLDFNSFAYDASFRGGVNVTALPDVLGSFGVVTAPGQGGGPDIRVFIPNGVGSDVARFQAYNPNFFGGVNVGVAPIGPNGENAILTGAGPGGGPHVKAFLANATGPVTTLLSFLAFDPAFTGGIYVG